jgi:hypothetical protein
MGSTALAFACRPKDAAVAPVAPAVPAATVDPVRDSFALGFQWPVFDPYPR